MVGFERNAQDLVKQRAWAVHNELQKMMALYERLDEPTPSLEKSAWFAVLEKIYLQELPLAKLLDESELIVQAEGPAVSSENPRIDVVTWLCDGIQTQTRALTASALNLGKRARVVQSLQFRLTGLVPGSLYAGFSIVRDALITTVTQLALADDESNPKKNDQSESIVDQINVLEVAKNSMQNLARVSATADRAHISEELSEQISDPAQRDASLMAAFKLAPTGRNGVHSVRLHSKFAGEESHEGTLDANNRAVIQDIVRNRPLLTTSRKTGHFVGQLRGLDLDKTRVDLRSIPGVGSLRCIVHLDAATAGQVIGQWVKVTGDYEVNANDKPRLMVAQNIEIVEEPSLAEQLRRD